MYANADLTGAADQLTVGAWNDIQLTGVEIPAAPNNVPGTVYLFVEREDLAWSQGFEFVLTDSDAVIIIPPPSRTIGRGFRGRTPL